MRKIAVILTVIMMALVLLLHIKIISREFIFFYVGFGILSAYLNYQWGKKNKILWGFIGFFTGVYGLVFHFLLIAITERGLKKRRQVL